MLEQLVFIILSAITLGSAFVVVTQRNLFRAAIYLVASLAGVAGLFVLLEAGFLAMVQIFIYAGAISILIIFAVMLTRRVANPDTPQRNAQWTASLVLVLVLFVILLLMLLPDPVTLPIIDLTVGGIAWPESDAAVSENSIAMLGRALVDSEQYVVPFEVASVLLLVAMIGSVYIVYPRRGSVTVEEGEAAVSPTQPQGGGTKAEVEEET